MFAAATGCGSVKNEQPADAPATTDTAVDTPPDTHVAVWSAHMPVVVGHPGNVRNPVTFGDGLNVYFSDTGSSAGDVFDAFTASRTTAAEDFGTASPIPVVNVSGQQARYLEISSDGLELFYSNGDLGPLMVSTRTNLGAPFSTPVAVGNGISGNFPSISGDRLSLYFITQTNGINGELRVVTRTAVGQPFGPSSVVALNGAVEIYSSIDVSEDELAIVRAPALTGPTPAPVIINRRATKTAPFDTTETLPMMDFTNCAFGSARFSKQDTELWTGQNAGNNKEGAFVSRLQ